MKLDCGGHLTHGSKVNFSGKWFHAYGYGVIEESYLIDMSEVEKLAKQHRPKLIITGGSAYPRYIDFAEFRRIADDVGAYLLIDMAHFAGLVAGKAFPSPFPHAHVVTTTTHKTLRGPRGGMILANDLEIGKKLNSSVFPGMQGGPLMHAIAGKAVAFKEALQPEFQTYARQVVKNAQVFAQELMNHEMKVLSGGTDSHLVVVDLRPQNLNGFDTANALERAGITCNKNSICNDPLPPTKTSGLRFGSPALTTRGMKEPEFKWIAEAIVRVLLALLGEDSPTIEKQVRRDVIDLCKAFPIYADF
jgi:glycine hydroxymethyltransferase